MDEKQESGLLKAMLREHPALLVSVVYVAASTIGMVYSWDFLRHFGINVFNYAQIGDFLLASLKEPYTWLLVFAALLAMVFDNAMSRRAQGKVKRRWLKWYSSPTYRTINHLVAIGMMLFFLHLYAINQVEKVRDGEGELVQVSLADDSSPRRATLLGTTGQFLFLYNTESRQVDIHPHENVQTISFQAPSQD